MKKLRKLLLILLGTFFVLILSIHFLLSYKAKALLQNAVVKASHGLYRLEADRVTFYYINAGIKAEALKLIPATQQARQASITLEKVEIRLQSLWHLIFDRQLTVQKIEFIRPDIVAYAKKKSGTGADKKGIAETIKNAQQKLFELIDVLNVRNLTIADAAIKIFKADTINNSYFSLNHFNLSLKDIDIEKAAAGGKPVFKLDGTLNFNHPDIHLPDSTVSASLGNLTSSVATRSLQIDSLQLQVRGGDKEPQFVRLSMIRIAKLNWDRFLNEGLFELDSLIARSGIADISLKKKNKDSAVTRQTAPKIYKGSSFIIHHALIADIGYTLHTKNTKHNLQKQVAMNLQGDSLYLKNLSIIHERQPAFSVDELNVAIKDFKANDEDGSRSVSLKGLSISQQSLVLQQYLFETNKADKDRNYMRVSIPAFRLENFSLEELFQKQLAASSIILEQPDITIDIRQIKQKDGKPKKDINEAISGIMQSVSKKVKLGEIVIKDGDFMLLPTLSPKDQVTLTGLSLVVDASKLPQVRSAMDLIHAVKQLNSEGFVITGKNIYLKVREMQLLNNPRGLQFGSIEGQFGEGKSVDLKGVTILNRNAAFDPTQADGLHISDFIVKSGTITLNGNKKSSSKSKASGTTPDIRIDNLSLQHIVFKLNQDDKVGISTALDFDARNLEFKNKFLYWSTLKVEASETGAALNNTSFGMGSMTVLQPGTILIRKPSGRTKTASSEIDFIADELALNIGLQSTDMPKLKIAGIKMTKPSLKILLQKQDKASAAPKKESKGIKKDITLDRLELVQPAIDLTIKDNKGVQTNKHQVFTGTFLVENIHTLNANNQPEFSVEKLHYATLAPKSEIGGRQLQPSALAITASNLVFNPTTKFFSLLIDSAYVRDITQTFIGKKQDTISIKVGEVGLSNFRYSKGDSLQWQQLMHTTNWWAKGIDFALLSSKQTIRAWNMQAANNKSISFSLDSFAILNRKTRDELWASTPYEKGYDIITGGKIKGEGVDAQVVNKKLQIQMKKLTTNNIHFTTEKDKTKREDTIDYRPLLVKQIMQIPLPLMIDSVLLNNARVDAHEKSKKTGQLTHIFFTEMNGYISNVKTNNIKDLDTLDLRVRARFYGTDVVRVHFKQSYFDTLQGFWMRVRMSHFNMPEMDRLLTPLMGLKIESGEVDSLLLVANGNDFFAFGTMDMRYHNLKAKLLKTEDTKGKFFVSIANFFTGTLLRKHDNGRTDLLYKERVRKRGIFNFWGKIALEGLLTNLGIKRDKSERKKFENAVKKYKLPEKYWQEDDN